MSKSGKIKRVSGKIALNKPYSVQKIKKEPTLEERKLSYLEDEFGEFIPLLRAYIAPDNGWCLYFKQGELSAQLYEYGKTHSKVWVQFTDEEGREQILEKSFPIFPTDADRIICTPRDQYIRDIGSIKRKV